jgi:hypothetical protein
MLREAIHMTLSYARRVSLALTVTVLVGFGVLGRAQTMGSPERYRANAVNLDVGAQGPIDITIERWSTDAERDKLMSVLLNEGPEKLLDTLQGMHHVGYFNAPGRLRWDLRFARKTALPEGGERIVLATDRPISFREAANQTRTLDYPFTVIELHVNKDGEGEGKMSVATKIIPDKEANTITLENWGTQPVSLKLVHREKMSQ